MGSPLVDRRTARLSVGLAAAGSLMLTAGLGIWAVTALSHAIPHSEHTVAWLAVVALITAGACCGVLMIVVLLGSAGRNAEPARLSWPVDPRQRGPLPPGAQRPGPPRPGPRMPPPGPPTGPPPSAGPRRPGPGEPPDPGMPPDAGPPPDDEPVLGGWSPDPAYRTDEGPELADWPDPPTGGGPGFAAGEWSGPDGGFVPQAGTAADEWSGPDGGFTPPTDGGFTLDSEPVAGGWAGPDDDHSGQAGWAGADNGATPHDAVAADNWAAADADLLPGAVLGQGEWTVRAPEADLDAEPGPAADPALPPASPPALNLWPGQDAAPPTETPPTQTLATEALATEALATEALATETPLTETPASPAAEQPAEDDDADELPRRVESAFNVWGRRNPATAPDAGPAASPADTVPPDTVPADTVLPDTVPPDIVPTNAALTDVTAAGPATPLAPDPDQVAGSTPSTRDWVEHAAAQLRDADLLPHRDLLPDADAGLLEPVDDEAEQDPILRPPAPRRRSGPAPGWNPDSEEDWLRVLRGLRASEDS